MNMQNTKTNYALPLIMLLALILRIYGIGDESLWIDEGQTVTYATKSFAGIIEYCARDVHPPLYLFIMHLWTSAFGISEAALRLPSAIFGVIAVYLTFKVGEKLMNSTGALLGAFFMAVSYMGINFSQEARSYTMLLTAILLSCHSLLLYIEKPDNKNFLYYAASVALMLYIHTFTVFIIMFHQLYFINDWFTNSGQRLKRLVNWISVNIAALVIFSPWLFFLVRQVLAKLGGEGPGSWVPVPDHITAWRTLIQLSGGEAPLAAATLALLIFLIAAAIPQLRKKLIAPSSRPAGTKTGLFLSLWFLCAVAAPFIVSLILSPIYVERYAIQFLPGFCLFLGLIMSRLEPVFLKSAVIFLFLGTTTHGLWLYYTTYDKEQWREVAQFIKDNIKPGEALVMSAPWIYEPFTYYFPDVGDPQIIQAFSHVNLRKETEKYDNIWLVQAHEFFSDPGGSIPAMLSESRLIKQHRDFKEGIKVNPILVHFQSIRATKYDAGRMQDYLRSGKDDNKESSSAESLVKGLDDGLIIENSNIKKYADGNSFKTGADSKLRYRIAKNKIIGEGAISFRIHPEWKKERKKRILLMAKGPKWDKGSVFLELSPENSLRAIFFKNGFSGIVQGPPVDLADRWHSLTLSWNRQKTTIFLDGKVYAQADLPSPFQSDFKTLHLGADHQNKFSAPAEYDDLMIFETGISADAAMTHHNKGDANPGYWYDLDLKGRRDRNGAEKGFKSGREQFFTAVVPKTGSQKTSSGEAAFTFIPDWSAGDSKQRVLLAFYGSAWNMGSMFLEKTPQDFLQLIRWENGNPSCVAGQEIKDWAKNQPHKITMSWNKDSIELTIDGKYHSTACSPESVSEFKSISIGNDMSGSLPAKGTFEKISIKD
ncbi:glycosyltransferase family 39 protein [Maridesulfovibrio zosterae]|uniref:glycosyltransferase family 39 protein n=1 Tax=Maridesulfovibrio zosterae TaxID=82171 RepID=UPI000411A087|nr:glycosyltransferase family 39 protein [Maridesulfovibrio zosterae]